MLARTIVTGTLLMGAFVVLGPEADAQKPIRQHPVQGPLERVVYDLGSGEFTRLHAPRSGAAGSTGVDPMPADTARAVANCFLNTRTMGFFATGTTDTEWRDWARKSTGKTGFVFRFFFAYATTANDPTNPVPGPGASLEVAFFQGETGFCTPGGTEIADSRFQFTNLPGAAGTLASNTAAGFLITAIVPFNNLFAAFDGKLGWSYGFLDDDGTGGALTGPLMTSFVTENTCSADAFDLYNRRPSSTGTCLGSFFFQGCEPLPQPPNGNGCATFYMGIGEDDGAAVGSASCWNPTAANPTTWATVSGPKLCGTWDTLVSPVNHTRVGFVVSLNMGSPQGNLCYNGSFPPKLNGTALYARAPYAPGDGPKLFRFTGTIATPAPDPTLFVVPIPLDGNLIGMRFCTQAFGINFGPITTFGLNAQVIEIGTS